ncbi:receptor-like protein EIX2 [Cajanus cajan]|uniref:receptor-like protein EIX2 n=1 Tax=Cajanus cajan TaxID=3821 RepID=UPI0010FB348B|nr:receptor-like protein EIX2 [Cajanus cajan]
MDLADNNFSGSIPRCIGDLRGMMIKGVEAQPAFTYDANEWGKRNFKQVLKENEYDYTKEYKYPYLVNIDLSSNNLMGSIPDDLTSLSGLTGLNLSRNHLSGNIPSNIQKMKSLESLDFSNNSLSGPIPTVMSFMDNLGFLNLSYNNFLGLIPINDHFLTFDNRSFLGNSRLCGGPLTNKCSIGDGVRVPTSVDHEDKNDNNDKKEKDWSLETHFPYVDGVVDKMYVAIMVRVARDRQKRLVVGGDYLPITIHMIQSSICMIMDVFPSNVKFVLLWLLCTFMFNSVTCSLKVHCNEKDVHILLLFKEGVTDPSGFLSSWITQQHCCQWTGIKCDSITGRVTELNLPCHAGDKDHKSHCLSGQLNLSLLELQFLSYLNLSNNAFKGIQHNPKCVNMSRDARSHHCTNSSNLQVLDLSYNRDILIDNLHWISHLSSLQYLNLDGVDLHKEINWLQSVTMLPSLLELHMESCQLENINPSIQYANFTSLQVLDLADNIFLSYELPTWLFNLSSDISHIDLSQNQIHGQLSNMLSNIRSIKFLNLSYNALSGPIPNWIGQLEQLQELDLSHNSFSGPIPTSLGNLSSLVVLKLNLNNLNGNLPESFGQLCNLEVLTVADNSLTGIVSERNLRSLSKLKHLYLSSPALIYDFDPEWIPPFDLQGVWLGYVGGKLPSWLFTQSSLRTLIITDSTASFEPLDKFWNFTTQLEFLSLSNNSIGGNMSNVLLTSRIVWLTSNNLGGGVPRLSPNVVLLNLDGNSLSGSISPLLCHKMTEKSNLKSLDLRYNLLSGELTDCWNNWESLVRVSLGNNNLTGKIPHSMGSLSNLLSLNLNRNNLYGDIPLSLKNCKNLLILDLGNNNFSGAVPSWMGQSLETLQLRSNQFSGNIPPQICQLNSLMVMDFANNSLSGPIPQCLHNITAMLSDSTSTYEIRFRVETTDSIMDFVFPVGLLIKGSELIYKDMVYVIDLSSNSLSGTVPSEIFMLTRLQSLNLSRNQLVGTIPEKIGNMKQLESIDLSSNRLWGEIPQSMSGLSFLGVLNLSFNNFMGKIPSGTQLQSFTNLSYMGNHQLCGPPLTKICPEDEESNNTKPIVEDEDDDYTSAVHSWFYMGLGIGFAVGFWGVLGAIFFNRKCRHAYFRFLHRLYDMLIQI